MYFSFFKCSILSAFGTTVKVLRFQTLYSILFWSKFCFLMQLFLKIFSGMANSVDPDQTALKEQSDLGLHSLHMSFCQKLWCMKFLV